MSTTDLEVGYADMLRAIRRETDSRADLLAVKALPEIGDAAPVLAATQVRAFLALRDLYREAYPGGAR